MNYVKTYESYISGDFINEASTDSIQSLQDRIKQLQDTGTKLKAKDWAATIERKKKSVDSAKEKKDNLRLAVAEREYQIVELKKQKSDLRINMISKEIEFLQSKLTYQQESVAIQDQIEKLKPKTKS